MQTSKSLPMSQDIFYNGYRRYPKVQLLIHIDEFYGNLLLTIQKFPSLPVSDNHHFVGLDQFLLEEVHKLEVLLLGHSDHGIQEHLVVGLRKLDSGEQIRSDTIEQGDVVGQELG